MKRKLIATALTVALAGLGGHAYTSAEIDQVQARAEQDDPGALLDVGRRYLKGIDVPRDPERGIAYLERLLERGTRESAYAHTELARHYDRSDRSAAGHGKMLHHYRTAAGLGDTEAQLRLGQILLELVWQGGHDATYLEQMRASAVALLEHAAKSGKSDAAYELAQAYSNGRGVGVDHAKALDWLRKAAEASHIAASYQYAKHLLSDTDSPDYGPITAKHYLARAARADHPRALLDIAEIYETGEHWTPNLQRAKDYADRAVKVGVVEAVPLARRVDVALAARQEAERIAKERAEAERAEAERIAQEAERQRKHDAEAALHAAAKVALPDAEPAVTYAPTDVSNSLAITIESAVPDREMARLQEELQRSKREAVSLRAAIQDLTERLTKITKERDDAIAMLGSQGRRGVGDEQRIAVAGRGGDKENQDGLEAFHAGDHRKAFRLFSSAAKQGNREAINNVGMMYLRGIGVDQSPVDAVEYFRRAADAGHSVAATNLGRIYEHGLAGTVDNARARVWYQRAKQLSNEQVAQERKVASL